MNSEHNIYSSTDRHTVIEICKDISSHTKYEY